jgi:hypothetical protein
VFWSRCPPSDLSCATSPAASDPCKHRCALRARSTVVWQRRPSGSSASASTPTSNTRPQRPVTRPTAQIGSHTSGGTPRTKGHPWNTRRPIQDSSPGAGSERPPSGLHRLWPAALFNRLFASAVLSRQHEAHDGTGSTSFAEYPESALATRGSAIKFSPAARAADRISNLASDADALHRREANLSRGWRGPAGRGGGAGTPGPGFPRPRRPSHWPRAGWLRLVRGAQPINAGLGTAAPDVPARTWAPSTPSAPSRA